MKKALVIALMFVLGLGFAAFATGVLSGDWDTDISLYPAASEFSGFIKSFTSEVNIDLTVGGFVFGMESTFGLAGLTGMDFNVDGALGAFTLDFDIDFAPMILTETSTVYTGLALVDACGGTTLKGMTWTKKTVTDTYNAGFDDMKAEVSVSIAGVNLGSVFFLEGVDSESEETVSGIWFAATPSYTTFAQPEQQSGSYTVADPTKIGAGWKFSGSGSFGTATLTGLAYFNLSEYSYNAYMGSYAITYVKDTFKKSGVYSVFCDDCIMRFTRAEVILEDVSFACTSFSAGVAFDCCGFVDAKFLVEDIGLGCCWDLNFDLLLTFSDTSKDISIEPEITLANACFTLDAAVTYAHSEASQFEITGVDIRGLTLSYNWNGVTLTADTSWDLTNHPILTSYYYGSTIYGPDSIYVWQPDTDATVATTTYNEVTDVCTITAATPAVNMSTGAGQWEMTSFACEYAQAWESLKIAVDGDSCCGGLFDVSAAIYFGDVYSLDDLDGTYYFDSDFDGSYTDEVAGTGFLVVYGTQDTDDIPSVLPWTADCNCCPCDDCAKEVDEMEWDADYVAKTSNRLFDWIETDVDVMFALGSNLEFTLGLDVNLWGWEDFTFGFEFTF